MAQRPHRSLTRQTCIFHVRETNLVYHTTSSQTRIGKIRTLKGTKRMNENKKAETRNMNSRQEVEKKEEGICWHHTLGFKERNLTVIADDDDCRLEERPVSCASHAQSAAMFSKKYSRKKKAQWRLFFLNIYIYNFWGGGGMGVSAHIMIALVQAPQFLYLGYYPTRNIKWQDSTIIPSKADHGCIIFIM